MFQLLINWLSKIFFFTGRLGRKNGFDKKLTIEEERELFRLYREGDPSAEESLVRHNLRLVAHIVNKYKNTKFENDDLISVGSIGLMKAVRTFDPTKANNFSTYASRCIENEILMLLRNEKKRNGDKSLDEPVGTDKEGNEISLMDILESESGTMEHQAEIKSEFSKVETIIRKYLDGREREIISHRYGLFGQIPKTQMELSKEMGISRSYISRIEKKSLGIIKEHIKD